MAFINCEAVLGIGTDEVIFNTTVGEDYFFVPALEEVIFFCCCFDGYLSAFSDSATAGYGSSLFVASEGYGFFYRNKFGYCNSLKWMLSYKCILCI